MTHYLRRTARFKFERDPSNDMLVGPDGAHYEDEASAMYFGQLGLCGCGAPADVHKFILLCMAAKSEKHNEIIDLSKVEEIVTANASTAAEFIAHFLDAREVFEHGGSVHGCWLTERGKQMVEIGPIED